MCYGSLQCQRSIVRVGKNGNKDHQRKAAISERRTPNNPRQHRRKQIYYVYYSVSQDGWIEMK